MKALRIAAALFVALCAIAVGASGIRNASADKISVWADVIIRGDAARLSDASLSLELNGEAASCRMNGNAMCASGDSAGKYRFTLVIPSEVIIGCEDLTVVLELEKDEAERVDGKLLMELWEIDGGAWKYWAGAKMSTAAGEYEKQFEDRLEGHTVILRVTD